MANPRTVARLEAQIQRRAAHCLQFELSDPRAGFVTITRVELTSDLSSAKIHYSVLGDEAEKRRTAEMLEHAAGFVQRQVAGILHLRRTPHMRWYYDDSLVEAARLDTLIKEARARDRSINPEVDREAPPEPLDVPEPGSPQEEEVWRQHVEEEGETETDEIDDVDESDESE
jgi:ribosome-binding factor A